MTHFKNFFRENVETNIKKSQNANIKLFDKNLQKRSSRVVQYNMKIVIRGDRNVGKSTLLNRLKGRCFVEQYIPTEEVEVACIDWSYKNSDDQVKVEVWDVVDKSRMKVPSGLKLRNTSSMENATSVTYLDAEFLDVYKDSHGVIMLLDMTKSWTYQYVEREVCKLPDHIPVLVLANHRDMGNHRTVSGEKVMALLEQLPGYKRGIVKYWESSMKNGYGLVYVHKFLSIPFLLLQRERLVRQLLANEQEINVTLDGMDELEDSPGSTYESFTRSLTGARVSSPLTGRTSRTVHSGASSTTESSTGNNDGAPRSSEASQSLRTIADGSGRRETEVVDFVPDEQLEWSHFLELDKMDSGDDHVEMSASFPGKKYRNPMVTALQDDVDEE